MTTPQDKVRTVKKIVVVFDICSSTALLEDLLRTENQRLWRDLLIRMKTFLMCEEIETPFIIYKFIGDGWILLFNERDISGEWLLEFLEELCREYDRLFKKEIAKVLSGTGYYHHIREYDHKPNMKFLKQVRKNLGVQNLSKTLYRFKELNKVAVE